MLTRKAWKEHNEDLKLQSRSEDEMARSGSFGGFEEFRDWRLIVSHSFCFLQGMCVEWVGGRKSRVEDAISILKILQRF